jgi:hypothetical protein
MEDLDNKIKKGYEEYLRMSLATLSEESELYSKQWCVLTGLSCVSPHPHRHYTLTEFAFKCCANEEMYKRFINV